MNLIKLFLVLLVMGALLVPILNVFNEAVSFQDVDSNENMVNSGANIGIYLLPLVMIIVVIVLGIGYVFHKKSTTT